MNSVILFHGKAGSGKSTNANLLQDYLASKDYLVSRMSFAGPVYRLHDEIQKFMAHYGYPVQKKFRKLLQVVGTELGRECYGPEVWATIGAKDAEEFLQRVPAGSSGAVIFDDMRFPEEFRAGDYLKERGITVHRISLYAPEEVRKLRADKWPENTNHPSEIGLDDWTERFDIVINTTNGVEAAFEQLRSYLEDKL